MENSCEDSEKLVKRCRNLIWRKPNNGILLVSFLLFLFVLSNFTNHQIVKAHSASIQNGNVLTILTSLDPTITGEFEDHFLATPRAIELGIVEVDFKYASTLGGWTNMLNDPSKSIDLAWGFTCDYFDKLEEWNLLKTITNSTLYAYINESIPHVLLGQQFRSYNSSDLVWFGTSFQTYGYIVNHDFLDQYGFAVPTTWDELASPAYYIASNVDTISLAEPPVSIGNTRIYQIILQAFGWEEGWSILTRIGANAEIYPGTLDSLVAVIDGDSGVALCASPYGFKSKRMNPSIEYIIPEGQSTVDACPISLTKYCDDQEIAESFLEYIVSPEGQSIWLTPNIDLYPVNLLAFQTPLGQSRPDLNWTSLTTYEPHIFFDHDYALSTYRETISYFRDTIVLEHTLLRNAWGMMIQMIKNETIEASHFFELVNQLVALPDNLECYEVYFPELPCPSWRVFARNKYQSIIDELISINTPTVSSSSLSGFITILLIIVFSAVSSIRKRGIDFT
jgi:ABC-type Fe3+ transport system substrate-binding protein